VHRWQWYYFDAHTKDGYDLVVIMHNKPFMSWFPIVIFDVRLYHRNQIKFHYYLTFPQPEVRFGQKPFFIRCNPETHIQQTDDQFTIKMHDTNIHLELAFTNLFPDREVINKEMRFDIQSTFAWHIIAPLCSVDGTIRWQNEKIRIHGKGYHDSNSGSGPIRKLIKAWEWGKFYTEETLYIVSRILDTNMHKVYWALVCDKGGCEVNDSITVQDTSDVTELISPGAELHFVKQKQLLLGKIFFFVPSYQNSIQWVEKIREAVLAVIPEHGGFNRLRKGLANTEYERQKTYFTDEAGKPVESFWERMRF